MSDELNEERYQIEVALLDPNPFGPLYATYFDPIHRYCNLRLRHRKAADDASPRTAHQTTYHDAQYPSHILLPVIPGYQAKANRKWGMGLVAGC